MDYTESKDCRWLKWVFESPEQSLGWHQMVQNQNLVTVPTLSVIPFHGTVLVKHAEGFQVLPKHVELLNNYLDEAFRMSLLPDRWGFVRYVRHNFKTLPFNPPVFTPPPDMLTSGHHDLSNTAGTDAEIFWRKLFRCEQALRAGKQPAISLPPPLNYHDSLLIASAVVSARARRLEPRESDCHFYLKSSVEVENCVVQILRFGLADHDLSVKFAWGVLRICMGPHGAYFDIPSGMYDR